MHNGRPVICCIGDSLTEGDYGIPGQSGIANVQPRGYPYFLEKMTGAEVRNHGKCGWRSTRMLDWYRNGGFRVDDADCIILLLGTNGGQSSTEDTPDNRAYLELVELLAEDAPKAKLFVCTPPHATVNPAMSNCGFAPQVAEAVAFVRKTAGERSLRLIDLAADPHFTDETEPVMQPNDGLHFGEAGYRTLAGVIREAIGAPRTGE